MKPKLVAGVLGGAAVISLALVALQSSWRSDFTAPDSSGAGVSQPRATYLNRPGAEVPTQPTWDDFYAFIGRVEPCTAQIKFGGKRGNPKSDGSKMVCLDGIYAPQPGSCTVLSFGINNEWSFDDAMEAFGCKVYAFDPSMKVGDHIRNKDIYFFNLGISDARKTINYKKLSMKVDSYRGILNKIEKTDTVIDYLKMDVEGSELDFFANVLYEDAILLKNVKQIGMEIHPGKSELNRDALWKYMHQIQRLNFRLIFMEKNIFGKNLFTYHNKTVSRCFEVVWINENFRP